MASMVNTVTGPVEVDRLGGVLAHEHVLFGFPGYHGDGSFDAWNEDEFFAAVEPVAARIKKQGIDTIVDATPNDCGRDVGILRKVSERCGINILCATGYYYEKSGTATYWHHRRSLGYCPEDELYELMQRELTVGVGQTGIKAGVIKVATGMGEMSEYEQSLFRAACRLARENPDVRILTHCSHGQLLREQVDFFLSHDVNPRQIQLGHFCDTVDLTVQIHALETGFYAAFDRLGQVGFDGMPQDRDRLAAICGLVGAGYGDRIVLSVDRIYWFWGRELKIPQSFSEQCLRDWDWFKIIDVFLPKLCDMGLSEEQARRLVFENPTHFYKGD